MKTEDIEKIHSAGLITDEQRDRIIAHFGLKAEDNKFLVIISFIGAVLITAGIILLISAHWNEIPRGVKIAAGLVLMLGAHGIGWWLRGGGDASSPLSAAPPPRGRFPKTGEALQFIGSALFLANIALVGQIYHLESRTPNAFLLWFAGIAALPWLLRSKAQLVLSLAAFAIWFSCELNENDSLIYLGNQSQVLAYALLGLNFLGAGLLLRRTSFQGFSPVLETLGLLGMLLFAYPLTWAGFWGWSGREPQFCHWIIPALALTGSLSVALGAKNYSALNSQWRWTWTGALTGAAGLLTATFFAPHTRDWYWLGHMDGVNMVATISLFVFCLLQVQVGVWERSKFLVNLGVAFIGLDIISTYFGLFGTMAMTGAMFLVTGIFLIVFGVYLEKKRRKLMRQMKTPAIKEVA